MSEESKGSKFRDYRGTEGQVEDADNTPSERRRGMTRGRTGASRPKSPRRGVRDPGKSREGSEGEPSYGAPIDDRPEDRGKKKE